MSDQTDMNRGFLKDKLGNYQVDPPDEVWNEISGRIGEGRNRRRMILVFLASAASIALAISLGIHFFGPDRPRQNTLSQETGHPLKDQSEISAVAPSEDNNPLRQAEVEIEPEGEEQNPMEKSTAVLQPETPAESQELNIQELNPNELNTEEPNDKELDTGELTPQELELARDLSAYDMPEEEVQGSDTIIKLLPDVPGEDEALAANIMDEVTKREPRWMLGAALSPLYSYRDAGAGAIPDNQTESGLLSYSTGVHLSYRRNSRLAVETGIYFNKTGIAI